MPSLSPAQLLQRLAKGKPIPGILLLGEDAYLRQMCRRKIIEAYVPEGMRDWGVMRFSADEDDVSKILGQAQTLPMLSPRQVIVVRDVEVWERLGEESREALVEQLSAYLENPAPLSVLVLEAGHLDQRMKLAKTLAEKMLVVAAQLSEKPEERARLAGPLVLDMAKELGVAVDAEAAEELSEILNGELAAIRTELEKLSVYVGERRRITSADVELLVVSEKKYTVWELAEILAARQPAQALIFLDSVLREGEQPVAVVGAMAWMYRKLLEAQELPAAASGWQAASRLGMRPIMAELALRQSRKFPKADLLAGLTALSEADNRLKSGSGNQRAVMEFLVSRLAGSTVAQ